MYAVVSLCPLKAKLKQQGPSLDNVEVLKWLRDIANCRTHATLKKKPCDLFEIEKKHLLNLPHSQNPTLKNEAETHKNSWPIEQLQRPASSYDLLLEVEL